jgi:hypothetical protein
MGIALFSPTTQKLKKETHRYGIRPNELSNVCLQRFVTLEITICDFDDIGSSTSHLAGLKVDEKTVLGVAVEVRREAKNVASVEALGSV